MSAIELGPPTNSLKGSLTVPGDKSISHRAVIFSSLSQGVSQITNFLTGEDCMRTVEAFRQLGVQIEQTEDELTVYGKGISHLKEAELPVNFGNSGTTARLMSGVLAGLPLFTSVYGDPSLSRRPMDRVVHPLREMGAYIAGRKNASVLPLAFEGTKLKGTTHHLQVKSAQVKSALLLAGMLAEGRTTVMELGITRNHTEMLMSQFGININVEGSKITIEGGQQPTASNLRVPGDISSAAFFIVAAAICSNSSITIRDVGLNSTRDGIIQVMKHMGASVDANIHSYVGDEPVGDIQIKSSPLKGVNIEGEMIPNLIDEIPIVALAATQAEGTTVIKDARELRFKETDRIAAVVNNLRAIGAHVEPQEDGMIIHGPTPLRGGKVDSFGDHRIGMMGAIASLVCDAPVTIEDKECINISYPTFFDHLNQLTN
ncbi:3-phosphoshikimate 1-carboxyvinyltransferase [Halobacillus halophilus]|uniref:3-phosphoshikimate 1-carboxyvinyltransferase n=1 Tax=Halobacillus halophilus TaxID=1570 RepID=UPI001CD6D46E|nr:3-phosphoshikimate 1-carboxyvinyltransferase [Halobacillus halophilus]MCA1009459.1 3-phosphoshikimate 1-carboxyvinyltransferase [Halobacillus halophilus]